MTHRHLTDADVEALPLSAGRAELLEAIMSTPVRSPLAPASPPDPGRRHRRTRWSVPLAAAAVVAVLAVVPVLVGSGDGESQTTRDPGAATSSGAGQAPPDHHPEQVPAGYYVVLDAPGWRADDVDAGDTGQDETSYVRGDQTLEIMVRPAWSYDDYVADRSDITDPPGPGRSVEVVGAPARMWAYSARDRTVIRVPEGGTYVEVRGQGMGEAGFLQLLTGLRQVDLDGFEAALPDRLEPLPENVREAIDGIAGALRPDHGLVPTGEEAPDFDVPDVGDSYDVGVAVAGAVACRWVAAYSDARAEGDGAGVRDAARALGTSRDWPVLQEMEVVGDYPEVVWTYADAMAAGEDVRGYRGGLGCP